MTEHVASEKPDRESWDSYFMRFAEVASLRSTCDRRHVGAVLVHDRCIIATGYNGSIRGLPHCSDIGCLLIADAKGQQHCERTVHAEGNAIAQAALHGATVRGATLYVTTFPCHACFKLVVNAGIVRIVYQTTYQDRVPGAVDEAATLLRLSMVELVPTAAQDATSAGAVAVQGVAAAPVVPRLGMTEEEAGQLEFGPCTCSNTPGCDCPACEGVGALVCACGGRLIDSCFTGCKGFSLASWRGSWRR